MTEQARHKLSKAVGEAIEPFVEEVTPKPKPPPDTEEDLDRPMSHDELEDLCVHIPTAVIGYITGMSIDGIRNYFKRRVSVPQDVASKEARWPTAHAKKCVTLPPAASASRYRRAPSAEATRASTGTNAFMQQALK